jgi:hypothetical protein
MKYQVLLAAVTALLVTSRTVHGQTNSPAPYDPEEWAKLLARGCKNGDAKPLASFLQNWSSASEPVADELLPKKPEFERAVYALFAKFYAPDATRKKAEYVIVQDTVDVKLVDVGEPDDYWGTCEDGNAAAARKGAVSFLQIKDFRPALRVDRKKVLCFNGDRVDAMARFLSGKHSEYLARSYSQEPNGDEELDGTGPFSVRYAYLSKSLSVQRSPWGKGWRFETRPYVDLVVIGKDLKSAVIYFSEYDDDGGGSSTGGLALMRREGDNWRVIDKKSTWVE